MPHRGDQIGCDAVARERSASSPKSLDEALDGVDGADSKKPVVEVEGRTLSLSNLDKILYPATGFTKGQVIDYYVRIAPVLLPHSVDRPLTMHRFPGGVDDPNAFYEKQDSLHEVIEVQERLALAHEDKVDALRLDVDLLIV